MEKNKDPYNILLVEDNSGDIILVKDYLEEQFIAAQITVARNFKETLDILTGTSALFDIILLDLNLPDKNGESLINEIVAHAKTKCPVIVLTGYTDVEFSIKSISFGISDYLLKDELNAGVLYKSIIYAKERFASKLRLQESERKSSLLFNLSPKPMWVYDLETFKMINVNEAAIKHYGYSEEEFFSFDLVQLHVPEEREPVKKPLGMLIITDFLFRAISGR